MPRFRLLADGTLAADDERGGTLKGRWRWSRGELLVILEGAAAQGRYPWPDLARHAGGTSQ